MKFNKRMLEILYARIKYTFDRKQLCGCFTYAEVVYLYDVLRVNSVYRDNYRKVEWCKEKMKNGVNGRTWFYFDIRKDLCPPEKRHDIKKVPA